MRVLVASYLNSIYLYTKNLKNKYHGFRNN